MTLEPVDYGRVGGLILNKEHVAAFEELEFSTSDPVLYALHV